MTVFCLMTSQAFFHRRMGIFEGGLVSRRVAGGAARVTDDAHMKDVRRNDGRAFAVKKIQNEEQCRQYRSDGTDNFFHATLHAASNLNAAAPCQAIS